MKLRSDKNLALADLTYQVNGLAMRVHRELGGGQLEKAYQEALEFELTLAGISYEREKEYRIKYRDIVLKQKFYADFVVEGQLLVELKAQRGAISSFYKQVINYLAISKIEVALIYDFCGSSLENETSSPYPAIRFCLRDITAPLVIWM